MKINEDMLFFEKKLGFLLICSYLCTIFPKFIGKKLKINATA